MKDWQLYALVIAGGALLGYLMSKGGVAYVSKGAPLPPPESVTDPTLNFIDAPGML
jgi:hypothetical protein